MDGRHQLTGEERAHRLPDEVGRGDARDAEAVRDLGGKGRLARPGAAADEQHDRKIELVECVEAAEPAHRRRGLPGPEQVLGQLGELVEVEPVILDELRLGSACELVRTSQREPGGSERAGHAQSLIGLKSVP